MSDVLVAAERCVIASLVVGTASLSELRRYITRDDWLSSKHRRIWDVVCGLGDKGMPVTPQIVREATNGDFRDDEWVDLIDEATVVHDTIISCARQIAVAGRVRRVAAEASSFAHSAASYDGAAEYMLRDFAQRVATLVELPVDHPARPLTDYDTSGDPAVEPRQWSGLPTVDRITGGLRPGLTVVGARTGLGKSTFLLQVSVRFAQSGKTVLYADAEMSARELARRASVHTDGRTPREILVLSPESCDLAAIFSEARRIRPDLLCVDYVQLLPGEGANREQQVAYVSRSLHRLGLELEIPVLAAAQLRRHGSEQVTLEFLRESGALEQDAGLVLLIYPREEVMVIEIAKNRYGPTGHTTVLFDGPRLRFVEVEEGI